MEEEQKISNFINKRLEKFASFEDEQQMSPRKPSFSQGSPKAFLNQHPPQRASFQDDEYLNKTRKPSFSTSQGSSPKAFLNQHTPQRTSFEDDEYLNKTRKPSYSTSSPKASHTQPPPQRTSFKDEDYPRKTNFSTSQGSSPRASHTQHLPQKTSSTYQSSSQVHESHEAALFGYFAQDNSRSMNNQFHGKQEHLSRNEYERSSSGIDEYYGKTQWGADMMNNLERNNRVEDISKREYRRSVSGPMSLNDGKKELIGSPQRQEQMGFLHSSSGVHNYGQKTMFGSPKKQETMEFQRPTPGDFNYGKKEWIDSPKRQEPIEIMQPRTQQNYDQIGWSGSPQKREGIEIRRISPGVQNYAKKEYVGSPKIGDQRKMMQNLEANKVAGFSRGHGEYPLQAQHGLVDYQVKTPYMDSIEAAKLHGGVLILDFSKY